MLGVYMIHENKLVRTHIYEFLNISKVSNPLIAIFNYFRICFSYFVSCVIIEALRMLMLIFLKKRRFL